MGIKIDFTSPIPFSVGCIIHIQIPQALSTNLYSTVKYVYAYGLFGVMQSLPFRVEANSLIINDACNEFLPND